MNECNKGGEFAGSEARPDVTPEGRATSRHLDPRRDGHVWPDLAVSSGGVQMPRAEINGREREGRALAGAASEAREHLFLTKPRIIETNLKYRGKHCGRFTVRNADDNSHYRVYCKCWNCPYCGPRKARRIKRAIQTTAEANRLNRLVTLTLNPRLLNGEESVPYLNRTFAKLRTYLKRKFRTTVCFIRVLEFQQSGLAHLHILMDRYVPQAWLQSAWQAVGGGRQVNVKYVDIHRVTHYLAKYLTKDLFMSAPKRARRVTTSRGIHLIEKKPKDPRWEFIKRNIELLALIRGSSAISKQFDEGGVLKSFQDISGKTWESAF